jgi:hypothetical protein
LKRLLDYDELSGVSTFFHSDGETVTFEDVQDVEPIIEANKLLYNDFDERTPHKGDGFHRVASIPAVVMVELERQGIIDNAWNIKDERRFLRFLDDPENIYFRTRPGKLSR